MHHFLHPNLLKLWRFEAFNLRLRIPLLVLKIFTPFEQGSSDLARRYGGLGLGLAISRSLVQMHGGRITATSDGRDQGATFTVELPIAAAPDYPVSDELTGMETD
jgi:signal transduction histidine kinase